MFLHRSPPIVLTLLIWVRMLHLADASQEPNEIIVLLDSTAVAVMEATLSASRAGLVATGVRELDSLAVAYGLIEIQSSPQADVTNLSRRLYVFVFPQGVDVGTVCLAYRELPYVATAEPNYVVGAAGQEGGTGIEFSAGSPYAPGELIVTLKTDSASATAAYRQASRSSQVQVGITVLDSMANANQLLSIREFSGTAPLSQRMFILVFPATTDMLSLAGKYALLPYFEVAEPNYKVQATAVVSESPAFVPTAPTLRQNYPNPFNPSTEISFTLAQPSEIVLVVYDISGRKVATLAEGCWRAGEHTLTWDGRSENGSTVASGVYVYQLRTPAGPVLEEKMLLLR